MIVHELRSAANARALACCPVGEYARVYDLAGSPVDPSVWEPLPVHLIRDGSAGTADSDLVMLGVEPALTARAAEAVRDVIFSAGQLVPLRSRDGEFYFWNVTERRDALDLPRSEVRRFSSGRIMSVERWAFRPTAVAGAEAFKVPEFPRGYTFVTEGFLRRVVDEGLTGFAPLVVWQDDLHRAAG